MSCTFNTDELRDRRTELLNEDDPEVQRELETVERLLDSRGELA